MKARSTLFFRILPLAAVLALAVACSKTPNDAQVTSEIQARLGSDSGLQGKQLSVQAANGTVTLSGSVDNDAQREAAARYASGIPGVKQVVNNLQVGPPPASMPTAAAEPEPQPAPQEAPKPTPTRKHEPAPKRRSVVARDTTEMAAAGAGAAGAGAAMAHQDSPQ